MFRQELFENEGKFSLPFAQRIPLCFYRKNEKIFCRSQFETIGPGNVRGEYYVEYSCIDGRSVDEFGKKVLGLLTKYKLYGDLPQWHAEELKGQSQEEYGLRLTQQRMEFTGEKDFENLHRKWEECSIDYSVATDKYSIHLSWISPNGKKFYFESSPSTGKEGFLTFDPLPEFDDSIEPEKLGEMLMEAFDRSQRLKEKAYGNPFPRKELLLLDESGLEVRMPKDKHFRDAEDMGVAEIYQAYEYFPREDSEAAAIFSVGIGAEYDCDLSEEGIRKGLEKYHEAAEFLELQEVSHGIYTLRAEFRNKTTHKISYFLRQEEDLLLECTMEVYQPGKRKKLVEKLSVLFEEFALECRFKR